MQRSTIANAATMATEFKQRGYRLISGGTDNHMVMVDLRTKAVSGREAEAALESVGIIVNRNVIPNDPRPPDQASGIRVGASAISARGLGASAAEQIVGLIDRVISKRSKMGVMEEAASNVAASCSEHPVYACVD